jgi:hypothetical protein
VRAIDLPHPARAERGKDPVGTKASAGGEDHGEEGKGAAGGGEMVLGG